MAIRFLCPFGHRLMTPEQRAGKRGCCPICGQMVIVPVRNPGPSQRETQDWDAARAQGPTVDPGVLATLGFSDEDVSSTAQPPASPSSQSIATSPPATSASTRVFAAGPDPEPVQARPMPKPPVPVPAVEADVAFEGLDELLGTVATAQSGPLPGQRQGAVSIVVSPPPRATGASQTASASEVVSPASTLLVAASSAASARLNPSIPVASPAPRPMRLDRHWIQTVYWLAFALAAVTLFSAAPAMRHLNLLAAPTWARVMLLVATLQFAYIIWMVLVPDWSTVWIGMIVFAVVAAMYGMMVLAAWLTAAGNPLPFELAGSRATVAGWSAAVTLMNGLMIYVCGRISAAWRRAQGVRHGAVSPGPR